MTIFVDTNVLLDFLLGRTAFFPEARTIFAICEKRYVQGYISALSIPNIVYIMRKQLTEERMCEVIDTLLHIFKVADLKADDIQRATRLGFPDFEDALQSVAAARVKAAYLITRNLKDFSNSKVTALTPTELLTRLKDQETEA